MLAMAASPSKCLALPILSAKGSRKSNAGRSNKIAANYGSQVYYPQTTPLAPQLGSLASVTTDREEYTPVKHMENIIKVKSILTQVDDPLESMLTVDYLQKLGIDYHFKEEIEAMLGSLHEKFPVVKNERVNDDLFQVSLSFRLLRQAGYPISSDVFNKFTDETGRFKSTLRTDVQGLLSLYEASHLNTTNEEMLSRANEFSSNHLTSCMENLEPDVARLVNHTLLHPRHKTIYRYNARYYLDHCQTDHGINALARLDFNQVQSVHQKELQEVLRWWNNTGLAEELKFARNQPLKWYLWSMTMLHDPQFSKFRIELTKVISFIYIIDDFFDINGSPEELDIFTDAISKWELSAVETLPTYMQTCYTVLYNIVNEIAQTIFEEHGLNPIDSLKKSWTRLCNAFLLESRWLRSNKIPRADEYLKNAVISTGVGPVLLHAFFLLGQGITKEHIQFLECDPPILSCPATILRLWDDLGSEKDENQEGFDGSYVECYMKEYPQCSPKQARDQVKKLISSAWQDLNEECSSRGHFSPNLLTSCLNSARMVEVMYRYDDSQKLPIFEDYVNALLFKSM